MRAKIIALLLQWLFKYLRTHPEILPKVSEKIPGTLDDIALRVLSKLTGL